MTQPLRGIRIAITRARHQAQEQRAMLEEHGALVCEYPCIKIVPPQDAEPLDRALNALTRQEYDWLVITSSNSVDALSERIRALNLPLNALEAVKIAAVGPKTAKKIENHWGIAVELLPERNTAASLGSSLHLAPGVRLLLPQSALANVDLYETLRQNEIAVDQVEAYRTVVARGGDDVPAMLWEGLIDAVTFTSESTVRYFNKRLSYERGSLAMLDHVCVACIGPITAAAARSLGLNVDVLPEEYTLEGLTHGLVQYFTG